MNSRQRFLSACHGEQVDCTPVWFMRQAGRYLPGYQEIRKNYKVLEAAKTPSICEQITLMPVKELGVDAAVMYADIMLPLEGMRVKFRIEENVGPIISDPIRSVADVEKLGDFEAKRDVPYVLEAIRRVRTKLDATGHALIGFSGAPFTIASYLVEGGPSRDLPKTKKLLLGNPEAWNLLMAKLADMISAYLLAQIDAGADAVQLFDSWVGGLSLYDYERAVVPHVHRIFETLSRDHPDFPKIHFGTNTGHLLRAMQLAGGDVMSIDWRTSIQDARKVLGTRIAIQGNLEPAVLLVSDPDFLSGRTQRVLDDNDRSYGHIFNLGHGILRETPVENARFVVDCVHDKTRN
jgi:uroporphyrinogen decarboxylase